MYVISNSDGQLISGVSGVAHHQLSFVVLPPKVHAHAAVPAHIHRIVLESVFCVFVFLEFWVLGFGIMGLWDFVV